MKLAVLFLLPSAVLLSSCLTSRPTEPVVVEEPVALRAPDALRTCAEDPAKPDPADPYGIGGFILEQAAALDDCQRTLAERNAWEDEAAARLVP